MGDSVIELESVSRWYGPVLGLNKVSAQIGAGITGLLGPNGAGKSTFMKLVTGQIRPSAGQVRLWGQPVWDNPPVMRRVGYCPESDRFYESMTALEFVTTLTRLHGYSAAEAERRARRALETVMLADVMDRRLARFSKGMRQKCKLAQALAHDPDILILDEPLTGTDPVSRRHFIDLLRGLVSQRGVSILVSSHVLHEIEALTRTVLLIHHGRVLASGSVDRLRELIDEHPHRIRIGCDRPRELAQLALDLPNVTSVHLDDGVVEIETREPARCYKDLPRQALDAGLKLTALSSADNDLESVFRYLVTG
jgi:ABC-2 type transport system ATP-binding protein